MRRLLLILSLAISTQAIALNEAFFDERGVSSASANRETVWVNEGNLPTDCFLGYTVAADKMTVFSVGLAAFDAGIRKGDVVAAVSGKPFPHLLDSRIDAQSGEKISVEVLRGEKKKALSYTCPTSIVDVTSGNWRYYKVMRMLGVVVDADKRCASTALDIGAHQGLGMTLVWDHYYCQLARYRVFSAHDEIAKLLHFTAGVAVDFASYDKDASIKLNPKVEAWSKSLREMEFDDLAESLEKSYAASMSKFSTDSSGQSPEAVSVDPEERAEVAVESKDRKDEVSESACLFANNNWAAQWFYLIRTKDGSTRTSRWTSSKEQEKLDAEYHAATRDVCEGSWLTEWPRVRM